MTEQTEGWGFIVNSRVGHYWRKDGRSLCRKWLTIGDPAWSTAGEQCRECVRRRDREVQRAAKRGETTADD